MKTLISFVLLIMAASSVEAAIKMVKDKGSSQFMAIGNPSAIRIEGQGTGPEGELQLWEQGPHVFISGNLKIDLRSYSTGIALRDRHMKDKYLEVEKFQTAVLTLKEIRLSKAELQKNPETKANFAGTLDLHGIQKAVQGEFTLMPTAGNYTIHAKFPLKLSDFSILLPSFAGITVADQVEISTTSVVEKF